MSLDTITTDDFAALKPEDHALAIYLYSQRLSVLATRQELNAEAKQIQQMEMRQCLQLRKVHTTVLNEQLQNDGISELMGA